MTVSEILKKRRGISNSTRLQIIPEDPPVPDNNNDSTNAAPNENTTASITIPVTGPDSLEAVLRRVLGEVTQPKDARNQGGKSRTRSKAKEVVANEKSQFTSAERSQHLVNIHFPS
jgi:hypothetical protein